MMYDYTILRSGVKCDFSQCVLEEKEDASMNHQQQALVRYVQDHRDELIAFWKELVNHQGSAAEPELVKDLLHKVAVRFEQEGLTCRMVDTGHPIPMLVAVDGPERSGKPLMLCGHLDAVFPSDAYPENPFTIRDGVAYGPGVVDMKGGVAMMLYMVKALRHIGFDSRPIKIVLCGDEEVGHVGSRAPELIRAEAEGCFCSLNLETGRMDNCLAVGRKGNLDCHVVVHGVGGHVGNAFLEGRNAIEEMSHKILALQALTRYEEGVVVSVDVIKGGIVSNAIPDRCVIEIDCRFNRASDLDVIKQQILDVCSVTHVEGTTTEVIFVNDMPVFEKIPANEILLARINEAAEAMGYETFGAVIPGGNSDASYLSQAGIPVICACGVKGKNAHTMDECAYVETIFQRTAMLASAIASFADAEEIH